MLSLAREYRLVPSINETGDWPGNAYSFAEIALISV
jgi:hypothetical protein